MARPNPAGWHAKHRPLHPVNRARAAAGDQVLRRLRPVRGLLATTLALLTKTA